VTVVVGSRLVGGAGKTPFVRWLAAELIMRGIPVALCTSGYRRTGTESECPTGPVNPVTWGDETALLREAFPAVPFFVGKWRLKLAELCAARYPGHVMVLDDGLQHHRLQPHISILLQVDGVPEHFIPHGEIRAPKSLEQRVEFLIPQSDRVKETFAKDVRGIDVNLQDLAGHKVQVLTGIANGHRVEEYLKNEVGLVVTKAVHLPDHAELHNIDLEGLFDKEIVVVATAKDWVKLRSNPAESKFRWVIVDYRHQLKDSLAPAFLDEVVRQIHQHQGGKVGS
jgi:tetraacyldisaccharide 4'-kinase